MKINPDDPCANMTIRLKLAAMAMQGLVTGDEDYDEFTVAKSAFAMADAMIERANRDEGKQDEG